MHLGKVVGTVVATVKTPAHAGYRILLVQPYTYSGKEDGPVFAAIDLVDAGPGTWVTYVKGREAANALPDKFNPSDRTIMGIVDHVSLDQLEESRLPGVGGGGSGGGGGTRASRGPGDAGRIGDAGGHRDSGSTGDASSPGIGAGTDTDTSGGISGAGDSGPPAAR